MGNRWLRGAIRTGVVASSIVGAWVWIACSSPDRPPMDSSDNSTYGSGQSTYVKPDASPSDAGDAGVSCTSNDAAAELAVCSGKCVDLKSDKNNCGACGEPCGDAGLTCVNGTCQCAAPAVMCGQCVDITRDPNNCGACNHSCQGNGCANSTCEPATIASTSNGGIVSSLAVDAQNIYWTQGSPSAGAYLKPFSGGGTRLIGSGSDPRGIAVDPNYVYWIDFLTGALLRWPINGGNTVVLVGSSNPDGGSPPGSVGLAVDDQYVYWTDSLLGTVNQLALSTDPAPSTVMRGDPAIITIATGQGSPRALVVDANNVYWIDYASGAGSVKQAPKNSVNNVKILAPSEPLPTGIAVDRSNVYWTDATNDTTGAVKSVPIGGGPVTTIAQNQGTPIGVAVDTFPDAGQPFVYWTSYDNDAVLKATLDGGTPFPIASMQNNPSAILVDPKSVYWANKGNGVISKVIK